MPLELRIENGTVRPFWYGRFKINGQRICQNLDIKIAGTPPPSLSLKDQGDTAFEVSRAKAIEKLNGIVEEARSQRSSERLVEKLYELKTGEAIRSVKLAELPEEWAKIPRKRKPDERYASQCQSSLKKFAAFVVKENCKAREIAHVTKTIARAFLAAEEKRGGTAKTWNDTLVLLRATFQHLLPAGGINPFSGIPTKETETIFRKPFSPEELKAILEVAKEDEFIRPILITGMCSAMRRGDCCLLRWPDVDLDRQFITVKTAKAGQMVSIPIFPLLLEELQKRSANIRKGGYVFPEQAKMYLENPDGITWRVKKVLAVALGGPGGGGPELASVVAVSPEEARQRGEAYINGLPESEKKVRMQTVFNHYMDGMKLCDTAKAAGVSKGSVSGYLNAIEMAAKCRIVRGRTEGVSITARLKNDEGLLQTARAGGGRNASVRDFHSLRVTWVTLALTAGVPLELVQKVTGHKTTDVVLKHYFQPGREDFRKALQSAMPKLLTGPTISNGNSPALHDGDSASEVQAILKRMTGKTLKKDKARLMELVATL